MFKIQKFIYMCLFPTLLCNFSSFNRRRNTFLYHRRISFLCYLCNFQTANFFLGYVCVAFFHYFVTLFICQNQIFNMKGSQFLLLVHSTNRCVCCLFLEQFVIIILSSQQSKQKLNHLLFVLFKTDFA